MIVNEHKKLLKGRMMNIKKLFVTIMIIASLGSIIFFVPWSMILNTIKPLPDTIQVELDNNDFFEGTIVYVSNEQGNQTYAGGYHNRDAKTLAKPDDLFKIASITKLYIATAATMLIEEDILDLDEPLSEMLPEYKDKIENSESITLRNMIMHRSGLPNYTDHNFDWGNPPSANEDCLELVLGMSPEFKPDTRYQYSNTNYLLLGMIMDKVLEQGYQEYIDENILRPLKLINTYHTMDDIDTNRLMSGYVKGYQPDIKFNDFRSPAGSMVATAEDVGIFLRALNEGTLMTPSQQTIYKSIYNFEHTGFLPGYQSIARYDYESNTYIVVFGNTSEGSKWSDIEILYDRILKISKKNQ